MFITHKGGIKLHEIKVGITQGPTLKDKTQSSFTIQSFMRHTTYCILLHAR